MTATAAERATIVTDERLLLNVEQVATLLSCSKPTVFRLLREGKLTAVRMPSGRRRVRRSDLDAFVARLSA